MCFSRPLLPSSIWRCLHRRYPTVGKGRNFQPAVRSFCAKGHSQVGFAKRENSGLNKDRRLKFAGKPKGMNKQTRKTKLLDDGFMTAPGYPFSARDIFGDLRSRLSAEHRHPMSFERLARKCFLTRSQEHHLQLVRHLSPPTHVLGFLCLLQALAAAAETPIFHRDPLSSLQTPTLDDPRLAHAPGKTGQNCWSCLIRRRV